MVERGELGRGGKKLLIDSALRLSLAARLPLIAATLVGAATLVVAIVRLSEGVAINPWEPAIAMEAMRLNAGLPVYEPGRATHMYAHC